MLIKMPRIHLWMSTLDLLPNDKRNCLETVNVECVIIEGIPDYLSEDTQLGSSIGVDSVA